MKKRPTGYTPQIVTLLVAEGAEGTLGAGGRTTDSRASSEASKSDGLIMREPDSSAGVWKAAPASMLTVSLLALIVIALGVYPQHVLELLKRITLLQS